MEPPFEPRYSATLATGGALGSVGKKAHHFDADVAGNLSDRTDIDGGCDD